MVLFDDGSALDRERLPGAAAEPLASHDSVLGTLSTARASSRDRLLVIGLSTGMVAISLAALPIADMPLQRMPGLVAFQAGVVVALDGITALLLFSQFALLRQASMLVLGGTYLFSAVMALPQFLTFPDGLGTARLIPQTSPWLWMVWHGGFALWALGFLLVVTRGDATIRYPGRAITTTFVAVVATAGAVTAALIVWHDRLPVFFHAGDDGMTRALWYRLLAAGVIAAGVTAAIGLLWSRRQQTKLHVWLGLSLVAMVCEVFCAVTLSDRYTVYWYFARINGVVASAVVAALLLAQIGRLYRRLVAALTALRVTNRTLESRVADRTATLAGAVAEKDKALAERDLLLREVYHRVKNNLQLVEAMMAMQSSRLEDEAARDAFSATRRRLNALGLVHQQLMQAPDLATIQLDRFVAELCETVSFAADAKERGIAVSLSAEPVAADLDFAIPFGLLFNELFSNAFKHAFPTGGGTVSVEVNRSAGGIGTVIQDDGTGGGVTPVPRADSTGQRIVAALVRQLDGEMSVSVAPGGGTRVALRFPRDARKAAA
jgi:two-component sensor histidine kinase